MLDVVDWTAARIGMQVGRRIPDVISTLLGAGLREGEPEDVREVVRALRGSHW
jgi:hypothetical protein